MTKYLITYDIQSNKSRKKVSDLLIRYGYERVQFSVFCGLARSRHLKQMKLSFLELDLQPVDSILIIPFSKVNAEIQSKKISMLDFNKKVIVI